MARETFELRELDNDQSRQFVDVVQTFEVAEGARSTLRQQYPGSMRWARRGGREYLLRKEGQHETSLGPRTAETEEIYNRFEHGRERARDRVQASRARLDKMAPVNKALRLARVPTKTARILRHLADARLLGHNVIVVGTNSLYLYEAMAGVQLESGLLATTDVDLLLDARRKLRLTLWNHKPDSLMRYLKRADRSFEVDAPGGFRATNRDGFTVDLIHPESQPVMAASAPASIGAEEDLVAMAIDGLQWLINAPKVNGVVVGEDGLPLRMWCADPRVFALHKSWLSERADRRPPQRGRDAAQARVAAHLATHCLGLSFDDRALSALPAAIRDRAAMLERPEEEGFGR